MNSVAFDSRQFDAMMESLTGPELKKAALRTLRSSANILKKETERQFRSKVNINGIRIKYKNKKGKEVTKWKRIATVKVDPKELSAKVHILADFRAKFFEMGTKERRTKGHKVTGRYRLRPGGRVYKRRKGKGGARGRITAGWHFRKAQQLTEGPIFENIDKLMSKELIRISKKR